MKLEIDRTLVCSTAHLTEEDCQDFFHETTDLVVYEMGEYGWMVMARPIDRELTDERHSDNLERLLAFAREHECDWIRFDCDADTIEGFPVFEK